MTEVHGLPNLTKEDFDRIGLDVGELVPEYDLANLDERVQIRVEQHVAPKARVSDYAARMKTEPTPPILVTRDGVKVDGNTRVSAAAKIKRGFLPAVVLNIDYRTANKRDQAKVKALGARANRHGESLDKSERRTIVRTLIEDGWTNEMIGLYVGTTQSVATQIKDEIAAEDKFARVGLSINGDLRGASLRALGKAAELNDAPFKAIAELAGDAGLNSQEIGALAKGVREAGSDEAALALVQAERQNRGAQIEERKITGSGRPPASREVKRALGVVVKHDSNPAVAVEKAAHLKAEYLSALEKAYSVIGRVIELQKAEVAA